MSRQANAAGARHAEPRALVDGYVDAWEQGDVGGLAALVTEDATFSMPSHEGFTAAAA